MRNEHIAALDVLREIVSSLHISAGALAAFGAALDAHVCGAALEPNLARYVQQVLAALGASDAMERTDPSDALPLLAELRVFALTNSKLLFADTRGTGWADAEGALLQAAGDASVGVARSIRHSTARELDGLEERLERPGATFLDIGVGVAALSIEMARLWPNIRVVGVDRSAPALALALENVRTAGLSKRIELRQQDAQELPEADVFDLVWIPGAFIDREILPTLLQRVRRALRPGGWALFAMFCARQDPLADAVLRLRAAMFGGAVTDRQEIEDLMHERGFVQVHVRPRNPASITAIVAARRVP